MAPPVVKVSMMSLHTSNAIRTIKRSAHQLRRVEWTGFAVLTLVSFSIAALSFAATGGQL